MKAIFAVVVGGQDITMNLNPVLQSLRISDKAGMSSDTASLELDDREGQIVLPRPGSLVLISLGWEGQGMGRVFEGTVDEIRASGSRSGRTLSISAKGMDTRGKPKEGQRRHFDDTTIGDALSATAEKAGLTMSVDAELGKIKRPYIALDDESFVAFGERIAREVGGTFKIVGDRAILAKRNGGSSAGGASLPTVTAAWGSNLHSYDIAPILGRPVEKATRSRWYDKAKADWLATTAGTGTEGGITIKPAPFSEPDEDRAGEQTKADAAESDRKSGEGSVTIGGTVAAQPEGQCIVTGCRPGVDGAYRIESVDHDYSRSGWTTSLELRQPKGEAGKDSR
jgi:phage protein D